MRLFIVGVALVLSVSTTAAAQSRWTVSAGPEWVRWTPSTHLWGMRLRAEYDLTRPNRVFGLRLEGGALWTPTQNYFFSSGSTAQGGVEQTTDLMLGVSGAFTPFPRAPVSPFISLGIFGRQVWRQGSSFVQGSTLLHNDHFNYSRGDIMATLGLGLKVRLGGRSFQLELRSIQDHGGLTFGTRLPF